MTVPADWDSPSEGNDILCAKFSKGIFGTNPGMPFRLYTPETDSPVPLVVYIHGADCFGDDNEAQLSMHDIGTVLARPEWQRLNPCFILAPQCGPGSGSDHHVASDTIVKIVKTLMGDRRVDTNRIYIYGYSAGAAKTYRILKDEPEMFAAAVAICGATDKLRSERLTSTPLRMFHAADDMIVRATYKRHDDPDPAYYGSADLYAFLRDKSGEIEYTEYPPGYMKSHYGTDPHCSWVPVSRDKHVWEWMFAHSLD